MGMMQEFKTFVSKGNVLELGVGLIMATHFGQIVKSMVDDIIMPPIGLAIGGVDFSKLKIVLKEAQGETAEVAIRYGNFINLIITFLIVSFCVFMLVRLYNNFKKKEEAKPEAPAAAPKEEVLLTEIRDLLKKQQGQ